jgi:hypothetical protein
MQTFELHLDGARWDTDLFSHAIERTLLDCGLRSTLKGTLRAFPGCVHWHFKKGRASGTLELTMWPAEKRIWFSVQRGRRAAWIGCTGSEKESGIGFYQAALERSLREAEHA